MIYDCENFTLSDHDLDLEINSLSEWYACDNCSIYIDQDNKEGLIKYVLQAHSSYIKNNLEKEKLTMRLRAIYDMFFKLKKGSSDVNI